ncbi:DNA primase [Streptomyces nodosus]|uniref:DNA primase n=1 Tax=Streptomyces nodosus TaxID=40318 RepID=UPI00380A6A44
MMNRTALGLAIGAGYLLGRTRKMKLAFTVASLVAGKRKDLNPRALADRINQQLTENPQLKEMGDQLRQELRGAGKAASGALLDRRIEGIADRLHDRTAQLRDQLPGALPEGPEPSGPADRAEQERTGEEGPGRERAGEAEGDEETEAPRTEAAKGTPAESGERPRKSADERTPVRPEAAGRTGAEKTPGKASGKKAPADRAPGKRAAVKRTAPAKKSASARAGARRAAREAHGPSGEGRRSG